jgi:hypothetical protein
MGAMIGGFIIARGKQSNQRKYTDTLPRQFTMDYSLALLIASQQFGIEATSILALFEQGFGLGLALQEHSPIYLLLWCCGRQV